MTSWRWSRSSARPSPRITEGPCDDRFNRPPSYATIDAEDSDGASIRTVTSRMSQLSTPSYATHDPAISRPMSASTATFTHPPRYSGSPSTTPTSSRETADQADYSYLIRSGFKSEPWATLRLYDAVPPASRTSKRGKYPRFSNKDVMLGHVELSLSSSQIIKNIDLVLKGSIITGSIGEGGTMAFLDQSYALWDRKFGDPQDLSGNQLPSPPRRSYDGKLSGNWVFPFAIPFPRRVNLATLRVVYEGEGPVRFLPEILSTSQADVLVTRGQQRTTNQITPFDLKHESHFPNSPPTHFGPIRSSGCIRDTVTPFDLSGGLHAPEEASADFVPIVAEVPAPTSPAIEPFSLQRSSNSGSPAAFSGKHADRAPLQPTQFASGQLRRRGAIQMQNPETLVFESSYVLPQSFLEGAVGANIHYELSLIITHGRFSTKSRVSSAVIYEPSTIPPCITLPRQMAYRRRETPPGPVLDPEGWKQLPPVSIQGTYLDHRELTVEYRLFLAKPLSYARGTILPCCLTVACDDTSALDLLASPRTPRVRLRRFTRFLRNQAKIIKDDIFPTMYQVVGQTGDAAGKPKLSKTPLKLAQRSRLDQPRSGRFSIIPGASEIQPFVPSVDEEDGEDVIGPSDEDYEQVVGKWAAWCTPQSFTQGPQRRMLYGEIHLPRGLQPTCTFPLFNILYCVELLAPATNAFVPNLHRSLSANKGKSQTNEYAQPGDCQGGNERIYASQFVEITTDVRQDEPFPLPFIREH